MNLVVNFFVKLSKINFFFGFAVAIFNLVHDMGAITANIIWKPFLKYE